MRNQPRVITDNDTLFATYQDLDYGDVIVGRLRLKPSEETVLVDLAARGITLIPSGLSQLASRSKVLQARIFIEYMLPGTVAVHDLHDLFAVITLYQRNGFDRVVSKQDRRNAGMGILLWNTIEEVYSQAACGNIPFPFVLQPFTPGSRDIRVIILDDYIEAYERHNPSNFRHNLHGGGTSHPFEITDDQQDFCRRVMARGRFPYCHLDIMLLPSGKLYLGEINLRGGLKGARIKAAEYAAKLETIHQQILAAVMPE